MSVLIDLGSTIYQTIKYLIPIFTILFSIFLVSGILRTYIRSTVALKQITEKSSYLIFWIIVTVLLLIVVFVWVIPLIK